MHPFGYYAIHRVSEATGILGILEHSNSVFGDGTIGVGVGIGIGIDKTNGNSTPIPIPTPTPMTQSPHMENCWLGVRGVDKLAEICFTKPVVLREGLNGS
jgi:hypothetical protein